MTVSSTQSYVEYTGDGSTTAFTIPFYFLLNSDISVMVSDASGNVTELTNGSDFSVTGQGVSSGGTCSLNTAYSSGYTILIYREPPETQETAYYENGKFPAKSHEKALDKLTMLIQQFSWWLDSLALKKPNFFSKYFDAKNNRIANLSDPVNAQDAATKNYSDAGDAGLQSQITANLARTLRVPEPSVNQLYPVSGRRNSLLGFNSSGNPVPIFSMTDTADLALKLASNEEGLGASLVGLFPYGNVQNAVYYITLEMMPGEDDDTRFSQAMSIIASTGYPLRFGQKTYTFNSSQVYTDLFDIDMEGSGSGLTVFDVTHLSQGFRFGPDGSDSGSRARIRIKGLTINRTNYASYTGTIGPKNLYVSNRDGVLIEDVEVIGNIGYGIQTDYCSNVLINKCSVSNAVGDYTGQKAGTDGIHLYRTNSARVSNCYTFNLGDDGFSNGSYLTDYPAYDIVWENNLVYQCAGGFKSYSLATNIKYLGNTVDTVLQGAFYLTNDANAIDGSYITNVQISNNFIVNAWDSVTSGNVESGALRIRQWADNGVTNASSNISNVTFEDNICETCGVMVSHVTFDEYKRLANLYVNDNIFRSPKQISSTMVLRCAITISQTSCLVLSPLIIHI